jgi:hypothetical protein
MAGEEIQNRQPKREKGEGAYDCVDKFHLWDSLSGKKEAPVGASVGEAEAVPRRAIK